MSQTAAIPLSADHVTTSQAVVRAVADETDADPLDLDPLLETIDPDALDALFADGGRCPTVVEFTYANCDVLITDGAIQVTERAG